MLLTATHAQYVLQKYILQPETKTMVIHYNFILVKFLYIYLSVLYTLEKYKHIYLSTVFIYAFRNGENL